MDWFHMPDITLLHVILVIGFWIVIKVIAGCTDLLLAELRANRNEIAGVESAIHSLPNDVLTVKIDGGRKHYGPGESWREAADLDYELGER